MDSDRQEPCLDNSDRQISLVTNEITNSAELVRVGGLCSCSRDFNRRDIFTKSKTRILNETGFRKLFTTPQSYLF